jgi:hypothetical protein
MSKSFGGSEFATGIAEARSASTSHKTNPLAGIYARQGFKKTSRLKTGQPIMEREL